MPTPSAASLPNFNVAYVISDLHLGGPDNGQIFEAAAQFTALVEHIIESLRAARKQNKSERVALVINGDFVDFLAEPGAMVFNMASASSLLTRIFARPQFLPVLKALQKLVATDGVHLVITLGNHDIELALPDTRRVLMQLLTAGNPALEGRIELCFDGWGYRFQIGGRRALCLHGNEADVFNFTRYDELDRIIHDLQIFDQSDFGNTWEPSAGSYFVIHGLNTVKKRFPFIDLLKPEKWLAVAMLGLIDPSKIDLVDDLKRMNDQAKENEKSRPASQRRMLSWAGMAMDEARSMTPFSNRHDRNGHLESEIIEIAERALANNTIDELIRATSETQMLGMPDIVTPLRKTARWLKEQAVDLTNQIASSLTGTAREVHRQGIAKIARLFATDQPYDVGMMDQTDKLIIEGVRTGYDVVFAGHTHFRRIAQRPGGQGWYVNTGTWAGLISLTRSQIDSPEFDVIYDALMSPSRQKLRDVKLASDQPFLRYECTVAKMTADGAKRVNVTLGAVHASSSGSFAVSFPPETTAVLRD